VVTTACWGEMAKSPTAAAAEKKATAEKAAAAAHDEPPDGEMDLSMCPIGRAQYAIAAPSCVERVLSLMTSYDAANIIWRYLPSIVQRYMTRHGPCLMWRVHH